MLENFTEIIRTSSFYEFSFLLIAAAMTGLVGLLLRQPVIVSFIVTGIFLGPFGLDLLSTSESIDLLAELGITLLLFLVGLKLDLNLIRALGISSLLAGIGQVVVTTLAGFVLAIGLGFSLLNAAYIALALTFSSTIIVVKLLTDRKESDSLHGQIAIGILIVQDIFVILAMLLLAALGNQDDSANVSIFWNILQVFANGAALLMIVGLFMRYLATPLVNKMAHSSELLVTFAIGLAALLAASSDYLGLSKELGGLLAGVALASTPYREALISRLASLRDFLLLFFFITLGAHLDLSQIQSQIWIALIFSAFVLIGKPLIVLIVMGALGYRKRTGFLAGLTLSQISEFSLIFIALGVSIGHVDAATSGMITLNALITIALSIYLMTYSHSLYRFFERPLALFEWKKPVSYSDEDQKTSKRDYDFIVFGLGRYGSALVQNLREDGYHVLAIDFNPDVVDCWRKVGVHARYGDACDAEFIGHLPLATAQWVISAMPEHDLRLAREDPRFLLIDTLRAHQFKGKIAVSTQAINEVELLSRYGADIVFLPYHDAAEMAVRKIENF